MVDAEQEQAESTQKRYSGGGAHRLLSSVVRATARRQIWAEAVTRRLGGYPQSSTSALRTSGPRASPGHRTNPALSAGAVVHFSAAVSCRGSGRAGERCS